MPWCQGWLSSGMGVLHAPVLIIHLTCLSTSPLCPLSESGVGAGFLERRQDTRWKTNTSCSKSHVSLSWSLTPSRFLGHKTGVLPLLLDPTALLGGEKEKHQREVLLKSGDFNPCCKSLVATSDFAVPGKLEQ